MLSEPSLASETVTVDPVPLSFVISDDGRALLAVTENEDGTLELMTTPVAFINPNSIIVSPSIKAANENAIDSSVFHINIESSFAADNNADELEIMTDDPGNLQFFINRNREQAEIVEDLKEISEYSQNNREIQSLQAEATDKNLSKKGPGRPRKIVNVPSASVVRTKCEICGREFLKQMLYRKHMKHHADEKPHRCPKCPASFNIPINFTLHMAMHSTGKPKCPECGRKFTRMASLKSHMLMHEKEENLFCTECEDAFSTKAQLNAHLKLHNEKWLSDDVRKCKLCNKQFTQPALYRLHIREHYRLQTKIMKQTKRGMTQKTIYKCKICLKIFQKPSQLMRHIRIHTGEKPFKCTVCTRAFSQKSSLQIHMWQHIGVRPFSCEQCNARFSQKGNLNAHVLRVHNAPEGEPIYACTQCSCIFKKLGSLNGHMKKMHAEPVEEPVKCDSSTENDNQISENNILPQLASLNLSATNHPDSTEEKSFHNEKNDILQQALKNSGLSSNEKNTGVILKKSDAQTSYVTLVDRSPDGSLRRYVTIKQRRIGGIRWYACSFCHKEFKKPSDLIRHLRVHTQEKPFKCPFCYRSFALKSTMKAHERTHFGIKKYSCAICDKMFACHSSLTAHTRTHTKPHKCNACDSSFSTNTVLKSHMKIHTKAKSKLSPEAEMLVPQIVLDEPLLISDAGNRISVAQVQSKQRHVYDTGDEVGRPHKCWSCPAAFRKISHLKQHYRRHTGERPYKCSKCDRRFTSNSVLKAHLHTHEEARPFSCTVCNATFSTQSSQKRHLVTHSNKRPFMCPYCHKTFKTSVNCRKHMKIHKTELAQQQLEKQKTQDETELLPIEEKGRLPSVLSDNLNLTEGMGVNFQVNITPDFAQALTEEFRAITADKEGKVFLNDHHRTDEINQNLPGVDTDNSGTSQTLHADETGTITLPNYAGDQTLTPESIREIEETLNQQLYDIVHLNDTVTGSMESREQPVLNIIYDNPKGLESTIQPAMNQSMFGPSHFDTFDMSHITLQTDTEIDMGISSANSTSMASILPRSAQEEQRLVPVSSCDSLDNNQTPLSRNLVVVSSTQKVLEESKSSSSCPKFPKIIAKADTTNAAGMLNIHGKSNIHESAINSSPEKERMYTHHNTLISKKSGSLLDEKTLLQCHMCNKKGFTAETLKDHLKIHQGAKEFQCPECKQKFCTNGGLSRHLKMHASKQAEIWSCSICSEAFVNELQLKLHVKSHDMIRWNSSSIEPDSSQKETLFVNSDSSTIDRISSERITDSSISEKLLLDSVAERNMIKQPSDRTQKEKKEYKNNCKYCPKTFRKPSDLIRHIRTHTGERPYQCEYCEKSFAVKCTLDCHMKVHAGTKSFCCHVCNSYFATKGSLKVHMRLHTGSKPFRCPICDLRFRTSGHRKVHLVTHIKNSKGYDTKRKTKQNKKNSTISKADEQNVEQTIEENPNLNTLINHIRVLNIEPELPQNSEYPNLDTITIDGTEMTDQITFNPDGTILNNNSVLSVNESSELVANLQFLLATGFVTLSADESILPQLNETESNITSENQTLVAPGSHQVENILANDIIIGTQLDSLPGVQHNLVELDDCMRLVQMSQDSPVPQVSSLVTPQNQKKGVGKNQSKKECDICGKTFMKPCQVERHKRIHTGERPFKCDLCTKSFAQKATLQMHQKHHTGDRPHPCPHCDYSFTQKCNLQTHLRRVHQLDIVEGKKQRRNYQQLSSAKSIQEGNSHLNYNRILGLDDISFVEFLK